MDSSQALAITSCSYTDYYKGKHASFPDVYYLTEVS